MARLAFVMGSNGPEHFGRLKYASNDAHKIAEALMGIRCGFNVVQPSKEADAFDIRRQLYNIASSCRLGDTFVCYFSGHGELDRGELFLIVDSTTDDLFSSALPASDVIKAFNHCEAQNKLLILDCCRAGGALGFKSGPGLPVEELPIMPDNSLVIMASGRLEAAREFDSLEGSFLARHTYDALTDKFYQADKDEDNRLSIQDLMEWLKECALKHNSSSKDRVPLPYLFGQQRGDQFFLTDDAAGWKPYEIEWFDGSTILILPITPVGGIAVGIGKHLITNSQYKSFIKNYKLSMKDQFLKELSRILRRRTISQRFPNNKIFTEPEGEYFNQLTQKWEGGFYPWRDKSFSSPDKPIVCVSYRDTMGYCMWVNQKIDKSRQGSWTDLPLPAVWDFAAFGTDYPDLEPATWLTQTKQIHHKDQSPASIDTSGERTNKRGVSDMIGNVWEWCGRGDLHPSGNRITGTPPELRGGGFLDDISKITPLLRGARIPHSKSADLGFRIAVYMPVVYLPEYIQLQLKLSRRVDWDRDIVQNLRGWGETARPFGIDEL